MRQYILCFVVVVVVVVVVVAASKRRSIWNIISFNKLLCIFLENTTINDTHTLIILNIKKIELLTTYEIISRLYKFAVKFKCNKRNN